MCILAHDYEIVFLELPKCCQISIILGVDHELEFDIDN